MKINLFSVPISITSKPQALALVGEWLREFRAKGQRLKAKGNTDTDALSPYPLALSPKIVVTPNPEIIVAAQSDPELMKALQSADLSIPDGIGIVWALRILNTEYRILNKKYRIPNTEYRMDHSVFSIHNSVFSLSRLSGLDLMEGMILKGYSLKDRPLKVMLVGGRPGVAEKAAKKVQNLPSLEGSEPSIFALAGPQNISTISKSENDRLIAQINSFSPDLLFVAFGHPKQEKWLIANRESLTVGVAMAVGGALDQIADPSLRPPPYINSICLGWLYRLLRQPWRWRRQLALVKFGGMVLRDRILEGRR